MTLPQWMEDAKQRAEAVTPGPWKIDGDVSSLLDDEYAASWVVTPKEEWRSMQANFTADEMCQQEVDAKFIAASRTDIPKLLRACEVMHAALERAHRLAERMGDKLELEASVYTIQDDDYEGWYIRDVAQAALDKVGKL